MQVNFANIRPLAGKQDSGFEELCCQLARAEEPGEAIEFFRKGTPDRGVECLWRLNGGEELGWQAKFFLTALKAGQWAQIEDSYKRALKNHPRLVRYTVCLPIDRSDGGKSGGASMLTTWQKKVAAWQRLATDQGRTVEIEYWGRSELIERLSRSAHKGRLWFWFGSEELGPDWFEQRLDEAIKDAGRRYTPELHVELEVAEPFDGLARSGRFWGEATQLVRAMKAQEKRVLSEVRDTGQADTEKQLIECLDALILRCRDELIRPESSGVSEWKPIAWSVLEEHIESANTPLTLLRDAMLEEARERSRSSDKHTRQYSSAVHRAQAAIHAIDILRSALRSLARFCSGSAAKAANTPYLLLSGDAGQGKTHLLCDVSRRDCSEGAPRILLHGMHFRKGDPWPQILERLGLKCTRDEFLGALEASAQAAGKRVLIFIDAINEGEGRFIWREYLSGLVTTLKRSNWLGLVVSLRRGYEDLLPDDWEGTFLQVEHPGFAEEPLEACSRFFGYYGIQPTRPPILPEYANPLFLKLVCEGVQRSGLSQVPAGLDGITKVFEFYLEAINRTLCSPDRLDCDAAERPVLRAARATVELMSASDTQVLERASVKEAFDSILHTTSFERSLFRLMVTEGLLVEGREVVGGKPRDTVSFTYQRLADHLLAEGLLDAHLDSDHPERSFEDGSLLGDMFKDASIWFRQPGRCEALAVQIPERTGRELFTLVRHELPLHIAERTFIDSLLWRESRAISDETVAHVNQVLIDDDQYRSEFLNVLVALAPVPDHPLNADFLDSYLRRYPMAERDSFWTTFLHWEWAKGRSVERLIEWCWGEWSKSGLSEESIRLTGVALAWLLTSANSIIRDSATKALVRLFENRLAELSRVIEAFSEIDDPFVLERLMAVAYGCSMRSANDAGLANLTAVVHDSIFSDTDRTPHILTRSYARGVLGMTEQIDALGFDASRAEPPYRSEWPAVEIPSSEDVKRWDYQDSAPQQEWARVAIYQDVFSDLNDFCKYRIDGMAEWGSTPLSQPLPLSAKEQYEGFKGRLNEPMKTSLDQLSNLWSQKRRLAFTKIRPPFRLENDESGAPNDRSCGTRDPSVEQCEEHLDTQISEVEDELLGVMGHDDAGVFTELIRPLLRDGFDNRFHDRFDSQLARRWMLGRIIQLGWTNELFGRFDEMVGQVEPGRGASSRIGYKYQLIALYELLGRLSDNFWFFDGSYSDRTATYDGPWQLIGVRDIDPSNLVAVSQRQHWHDQSLVTWWTPVEYASWNDERDPQRWLSASEDLPDHAPMVAVTHPESAEKWLVLDTSYLWVEPTSTEFERHEVDHRQVWTRVRSYLARKDELGALVEQLAGKPLNAWVPHDLNSEGGVYLGEYHWASAYRYAYDSSDDDSRGWTRGYPKRLVGPILKTTVSYYTESGDRDRSLEESVHIELPCRELANGMNLKWMGREGEFLGRDGRVAILDPSLRLPGPGGLVVRQDCLEQFLKDADLGILWVVTGEKQFVFGGFGAHPDVGRLEISGSWTLMDGKIVGESWHKVVGGAS